ncbi:MAG: DUF2878 domain-containing protein [Kiritimatiellaeota bacterium]|nr:DUF2878 domain-containing protein [Kiritimatiellota bacterium]
MKRILNFALFQAGWFAAILTAASGRPAAALAVAGAAVGLSLWQFSVDRMRDLRLVMAVALIGFCLDTAQLRLGVFALAGAPRFPHLCPLWLAALWALLGTTLRGSLSWLAGRYWLSAILGAVAGPLSYLGGARLGAATLPVNHAFSVAALAVAWAVAMPLFVWLAHGSRFLGRTSQEAR